MAEPASPTEPPRAPPISASQATTVGSAIPIST